MGWIIKEARMGRQRDRPVIIQVTTMSGNVIPLVAITPCDDDYNANGRKDEKLPLLAGFLLGLSLR